VVSETSPRFWRTRRYLIAFSQCRGLLLSSSFSKGDDDSQFLSHLIRRVRPVFEVKRSFDFIAPRAGPPEH